MIVLEQKKEYRWIHPQHGRGIRTSTVGIGTASGGKLSTKKIRKLLESGYYGEEKKQAWLKVKKETIEKERKEKHALLSGCNLKSVI